MQGRWLGRSAARRSTTSLRLKEAQRGCTFCFTCEQTHRAITSGLVVIAALCAVACGQLRHVFNGSETISLYRASLSTICLVDYANFACYSLGAYGDPSLCRSEFCTLSDDITTCVPSKCDSWTFDCKCPDSQQHLPELTDWRCANFTPSNCPAYLCIVSGNVCSESEFHW